MKRFKLFLPTIILVGSILGSDKNLTKQDEIKDFFVSENLVTRKLVISEK